MTAETTWGPVLFATLVPVGVVIIGVLVRVIYQLGRLTEKIDNLEEDVGELRWRNGLPRHRRDPSV